MNVHQIHVDHTLVAELFITRLSAFAYLNMKETLRTRFVLFQDSLATLHLADQIRSVLFWTTVLLNAPAFQDTLSHLIPSGVVLKGEILVNQTLVVMELFATKIETHHAIVLNHLLEILIDHVQNQLKPCANQDLADTTQIVILLATASSVTAGLVSLATRTQHVRMSLQAHVCPIHAVTRLSVPSPRRASLCASAQTGWEETQPPVARVHNVPLTMAVL